jgi:hypothetical protein
VLCLVQADVDLYADLAPDGKAEDAAGEQPGSQPAALQPGNDTPMAAAAEDASLGAASPSTGAAEPSATHDVALYDDMSAEDAMAAIAQLLQRPGAEPGEVLRAFESELKPKQGLQQQAQDAWKRQLTLHVQVGLSLHLSPAHCAH